MKTKTLFATPLLAVALLGATAPTHAAPLKWHTLPAGLQEAKRTGKPLFVDFYADWCGPCKLLDKAYDEAAFKKEASRYILVKVDVDKHPDWALKYNASSLPTMAFLNSRGKEVGRKIGFSLPRGVKTEAQAIPGVAKDVAASMRYIRTKKL